MILAGGRCNENRRTDLYKPLNFLGACFFMAMASEAIAVPEGAGIVTKTSPWNTPFSESFAISPGNEARLDYRAGRFEVTLPDGRKVIVRDGLEETDVLNKEVVVSIADMNFDGYKDIAVDTGYGYGGVNIISEVYFWDAQTGGFQSKSLEVSNFDLDEKAGILSSAMRSGPQWYRTEYKFSNGVPWRYHEVIGPGIVEVHKFYNMAGKMIKKIVADPNREGDQPVPAVFTVPVDKVYFYTRPDENSKTRAYIVKGDKVEVLDQAGDFSEWLKIRYRGKKTFVRWIKAIDIEQEQ